MALDLTQFKAKVDQFVEASDWAKLFTDGDDTTTFETPTGTKKSFAKLQKELRQELLDELDSLAEALSGTAPPNGEKATGVLTFTQNTDVNNQGSITIGDYLLDLVDENAVGPFPGETLVIDPTFGGGDGLWTAGETATAVANKIDGVTIATGFTISATADGVDVSVIVNEAGTGGNVNVATSIDGASWSNATLVGGGSTAILPDFLGQIIRVGSSAPYTIYIAQSVDPIEWVAIAQLDDDGNLASLNGVIFKPLANVPSTPEEGTIYYDSTAKKLKFYNGTAWETVSSS